MTDALTQTSKARQQIERATTPEEANEARSRLKAIQKYLRNRTDQFDTAFEAAKLECEAAAKAGQLWATETNKAQRGKSKTFLISVPDAGFASTMDATICVRLGELDPQDVALYFDEMQDKKRYPTENGLHSLWKQMNGVEDEDRPWLRVYNIWNFAKCDDRFGISHPGMIPGQIIQNLNWYFTKPGDLVVDLFAGGGPSIDVCKEDNNDYGNRQCRAYDIEPRRPDIIKRDLIAEGIPDVSDAAMVFLDPPYWAQMKGQYSGHSTNLANLELPAFYDAIVSIANDSLAQGRGVVALIVGGAEFLGERSRGRDHAMEIFARVQGRLLQRIIVPYSTENYQAHDVNRTKAKKTMLNLYRDLLVWERE